MSPGPFTAGGVAAGRSLRRVITARPIKPGAAEVKGAISADHGHVNVLVRPPAVAISGRAIMGAARERDGAIAQLVRAADS